MTNTENENVVVSEKKWYALYTKPRHEFKAEAELLAENIETYLPVITTVKQWSDRKKKVTEPLFRGYIFIKALPKERFKAVIQKSVIRTIMFDGAPAVIPDWQIESVKKMLSSKSEFSIADELKVGTRVKVVNGPFDGIEGVIYFTPEKNRMLAISIEFINRSILVYLPPEHVVKKKSD
ncbi:MAG: UpxY family transcription antiterminator [Melioribacteraceae bacterium]|nr:UpxY family transcription antiterminator [Melioribacteraceae bacterium]MCF8393337.1 UpxY family transcription antiterminator [Melioribacteraceae bacterium]MCF8418902.1 UpxY family transcription antiterminator [Melioribacteraceae bacterium]